MHSNRTNLKHLLLYFFLLFPVVLEAQEKNPTRYPYGGERDSTRKESWMVVDPLNFRMPANFNDAILASAAYFGGSQLQNTIDFGGAIFASTASFNGSLFLTTIDFFRTKFDSTTYFRGAKFHKIANFIEARFHGTTDFYGATFGNWAYFVRDTLESINLLEVESKEYLDFENTNIKGTMRLGSHKPFKIDLTLANLTEAAVELYNIAQIKMPERKIEKLSLLDTLSYTAKENIIDNLKEKSFGGSKSAAFELDYLLAKSTMYQNKTDVYEHQKWYYVWKWPKWTFAWFYNATMGFGYRPFRIIWWALGVILLSALYYTIKMGKRINEYVTITFPSKRQKKSFSTFSTVVNCAYFSVMLFFTFRLKGDLLTFFDDKEKKFIIAEWLMGLAVYVAFLYHTSSVLQNIRSLFIGG